MAVDRQKLTERREALELSQPALAKKAKVSQQLISQLETGKNASTKKLPQIAKALGLMVSELDPDFYTEIQATPVPLISWIAAGKMTANDVQSLADAPRVYGQDLDPRGDWIALKVDGDSMDRISPPESIIFVNRKDKRMVANACYVIADEASGAATYKRWRPNPDRWEPVSTNAEHEPVFTEGGVAIRVIGRVRKSILDM